MKKLLAVAVVLAATATSAIAAHAPKAETPPDESVAAACYVWGAEWACVGHGCSWNGAFCVNP